jgi:hypothetical protein
MMALVTLFVCAWLGAVLFGAVSALSNIARQFTARSFPAVNGQIIHSSVETEWLGNKSKGQTAFFRSEMHYQYQVNGRTYEGSRYRFEPDQSDSNPGPATALVNAHPNGSSVTVFYNPREPEESLLSPGVTGHDLFLFPLFAFMAFGSLALRFLYGWWRDNFVRPETAGVRVASTSRYVRAQLPRYSPLMLGLGTMVLTALVSTLVIDDGRSHPASIQKIFNGWAVVIGASGAVAGAFWFRLFSGADDLVIERETGTITLPRTFGRRRNRTISIPQIVSADLIEVGSGKNYRCYPTLFLRDFEMKEVRLADWMDSRKGHIFVEWLREQIHP